MNLQLCCMLICYCFVFGDKYTATGPKRLVHAIQCALFWVYGLNKWHLRRDMVRLQPTLLHALALWRYANLYWYWYCRQIFIFPFLFLTLQQIHMTLTLTGLRVHYAIVVGLWSSTAWSESTLSSRIQLQRPIACSNNNSVMQLCGHRFNLAMISVV